MNIGGHVGARRGMLKEGRYGYIDTHGRLVIQPRYDKASDFTEGMAAVQIDGRWGYIDNTGQQVIPPRFQVAYEFTEGLAGVVADDYPYPQGYIDRTGKLVIPQRFAIAWPFS